MLVLSRQRDETIMIGDDVEITVVDIRGDKVRIGIEAPSKIAVHRKEVYEAIREENRRASRVSGEELDGLAQRLRVVRGEGAEAPEPKAKPVGAATVRARARDSTRPAERATGADGRRRA
jgi:carbon storage regulator